MTGYASWRRCRQEMYMVERRRIKRVLQTPYGCCPCVRGTEEQYMVSEKPESTTDRVQWCGQLPERLTGTETTRREDKEE